MCLNLKWKWMIAGVLSLLCVFAFTSTQSQAASEYKVAEIKTTKAKFYKTPSKKAKATAVKSTDLKRTYYVRESKKADGTTYYRLEKGVTSMGWIDGKVLKINNRTLLSKKKQTMYLLGRNNAYTMPATTSSNRSYNLEIRRGLSFAAERYEKVGTTYWYKGKIEGTTKLRWIRSDLLTTNGFVGVDLRKPSNVTAKDLQVLILSKGRTPDNILYKLAPEFIKAQSSTGVSAQFMFAHAALETGWGGSTISQYKNNLFGYQAYDTCPITCSKYFPKGEDGLKLYASRIVNNYLTVDGPYYYGKNVLAMNVKYATDPSWGEKIANIMQQIKPYNSSYYKGAKASTKKVSIARDFGSEIPSTKPQPSAFVALPSSISATINSSGASVYSIPYVYAPRVGSYAKGKKITLKAYHTDVKDFKNAKGAQSRWYRISYQNKQAWVRSDQITTTNLAFTTVDATLRSNAGTNYSKVTTAKKNTALKLVTSSSKPITKKDSKKATWYQVYQPSSTKKVWIRSDLMKIYR